MHISGTALYEATNGPDGLAEIRGPALGTNGYIGRKFGAVADLVELAQEVCHKGDVWISYGPRIRESGSTEDVEIVRCLIVDADRPSAHQKVAEFVSQTGLRPSAKILTGSITEGAPNAQYVWLIEPVDRELGADAMRRIAFAFDGDTKFVKSGAGMWRIDGTLNHKTTPPRKVELDFCDLDLVYEIEQFEVLPTVPAEVSSVAVPPPVPTDDEAAVIQRADAATFAAIGAGGDRNQTVWETWTTMLWLGGLSEEKAHDLGPALVAEINLLFPRSHPYLEVEARESIRERWRKGVRRKPFPELVEIEEAAANVPLRESIQKVRNVLFALSRRFGSLSFTRSLRQIADEAGVSVRTVELALEQLHKGGWIKRTRKAKEGKSARIKLCLPASTATTDTESHVPAVYPVSAQEMALQSQNPAAFAHSGLPLRGISFLAAAQRTVSADELADFIGVTPRTARRHLALYRRFGLVVKSANGAWKVDLSDVVEKLKTAAKALGTQWIWERRKRRHKAESSRFHSMRESLSQKYQSRARRTIHRLRGSRSKTAQSAPKQAPRRGPPSFSFAKHMKLPPPSRRLLKAVA